jgi:uncharacterized protein YlxW (UPF0749 family)
MSIDAISANLISDVVIAVAIWAFTTSVKSWVSKLINEQTLKIQETLSEITKTAQENKVSNAQIRAKVISLNNEIEKFEKKYEQLVRQISTIKCLRGKCEDFN